MQVLERVEFVSRVPDRFQVTFPYYTETPDLNGRSGWQSIQLPGVLLGAVGNPLVLLQQYDPDQGWLPFVQAVFAHAPPVPKEAWEEERAEWHRRLGFDDEYEHHHSRRRNREQMERMAAQPIFVSNDDRKMYHYPRGYEDEAHCQRVLPFHEFRHAEGYEYRNAQHTWDKHPVPADAKPDRWGDLPAPAPLSFRASGGHGAVAAWCAEMCSGRYHVAENGEVTFERHADWVHVKLRFQGAA